MSLPSAKLSSLLPLMIALPFLPGCSEQDPHNVETKTPLVATVNYPLAYFAGRIAGDVIDVHFPVIEGDPAFWNPRAAEIMRYQQADLVLLNGANYARWVPKVSLSQARLIDTSAHLGEKLIPLSDEVTHTHGPGGNHAHGDTAATTWLDPQLAIQQASAIRDAFTTKWPHYESELEQGYQALASDLKAIDAAAETAFGKFGNAPLVGSHPVYQYLTRRYGLNLRSVHWEPDEVPDETMWKELDVLMATHPARVMLWEAEPLAATKERLAAKGIASIVFDPCGNQPAEGDYLTVMKTNISNLGVCMRGKSDRLME